ncbi:hypothetical protein QTH91_01125 [Variovorax dokdonensis]|uniref:UvrD-like helicase ATP-binding domain-containing protein n=1 Tax=Variovorax dokdonensis TaxID=344883 RepID=A0ABT7N573_9BURK|nr:hypothetical protein [Variovorax dokdonensis]MDM0043072.1 hypothetical protein [Variovorax dokdonensis]
MTTFIPEWVKVPARLVHVKRMLSVLDGDYVIRRPLTADHRIVDFFVEHRSKGWLIVAVEQAPFGEIDPAQLFDTDARTLFERRLASLQKMACLEGQPAALVKVLVIMWSCSIEEARALMMQYLPKYGTRIVSREQFSSWTGKILEASLTLLSEEVSDSFRGTHFPEVEIPAACTTRRFFNRDNRASLKRHFLDQEQELASKLDLELPGDQASTARDFSVRLINGVAGSGKTLIALNRALLLAELFPKQRLLILIHNTPVVADIKERLHRVRGGIPESLEISTFFSWTCQQWRYAFGGAPKMPGDPYVVSYLVKQARSRWPDIKLSDGQLIAEMDFINEALVLDEAAYLEVNRAGRGFSLRPREREQIWSLYQAVAASLQASGLRMWSALPRDICLAGASTDRILKYDHILIDEAQFFAPSWFQVVKLSTAPDGQLFLCADPNQGFMKNRLSWKSAGLEVAGRTRKLQKSYRTTRAILEAASGVLAKLGSGNDEDYLRPDFRGMEPGVRPMVIYTDSPQDGVDRVLAEVSAIAAEDVLPLSAVLLIYGDAVQRSAFHEQLTRQLGVGKVWWFNEKGQKKAPPSGYGKDYLRMAYVETATGLEASVVFLVGVEQLFSGSEKVGLSEEAQSELREVNARKLYMAMTRAGQRLVLISSQHLPPELEALFDVVK